MLHFFKKKRLFVASDIGTSSLNMAAFSFSESRREAELCARDSQKIKNPAEDVNEFKKALNELRLFTEAAEARYAGRAEKIQVVLPYRMVRPLIHSFTFIRGRAEAPVTSEEITLLFREANQKAAGFAEIDEHAKHYLMTADMQKVAVDGYEIQNTLPAHGKEIEITALVAAWPAHFKSRFEEAVHGWGQDRLIPVPRLAQVFRYLLFHLGRDAKGVCLDIGGEDTGLLIFGEGALQYIEAFSFGGSDVTRAIAHEFRLTFNDAEVLKRQWVRGDLSSAASERLTKVASLVVGEWKAELAATLKKASGRQVIHPSIFITGGGALTPTLSLLLADPNFINEFAIAGREEVALLSPDEKELQYLPHWSFDTSADAVLFSTVSRMIQEAIIH